MDSDKLIGGTRTAEMQVEDGSDTDILTVDMDSSAESGSEYKPEGSSDSSAQSPLKREPSRVVQSCQKPSALPPSKPDGEELEDGRSTGKARPSDVMVKTSAKTDDGKRVWDKKHFCVYCKKPNSKIARHLERKHSKEMDVARATSFPKGSKRRAVLLEEIRNKGDYEHNIVVLEQGKGELVTWRQPEVKTKASDYLPCPHCLAFFIKTDLWKHEASCRVKKEKQSGKIKRIQSSASQLIPVPCSATQGCQDILHRMQQDAIACHVKNDPLICKFGDTLYEKHGHNKFQHVYISQKMRELGRFVLAVKDIDKSVETLQDICVPAKFKMAVSGARAVSGFIHQQNEFKTPSLACKIGYSLKRASQILVGESLMKGDKATEDNAKNFIQLLETNWNTYVSGRAIYTLKHAKWNKDDMIPLTEDIMKLQNHLKALQQNAVKKLTEGPNPAAWKTLCSSLLTDIILFNRRREGEASKLLLKTYKSRNTAPAHPEIYATLSKLEQSLSDNLTRLEIRGKRERKVPVLLTAQMVSLLNVLIEHRRNAGVPKDNPFVFARISAMTNVRGSDCLRQFASECGAKHPERLTSTRLRKHIATLCQMMNLKDHEMDQVAKFMGHDIRVHREYYRLSENTLQLAKVSKLLIAIERGPQAYKGKSLEQIDFDANGPSDCSDAGNVKQSDERQGVGKKLPTAPLVQKDCGADGDSDCSETGHVKPTQSDERQGVGKKLPTAPLVQKDCGADGDSDCSETGHVKPTQSDPKARPQQKQPWSSPEKAAVWRHLAKFRAIKRAPGKQDCILCKESEPILKERSWKNIKNLVHNTIQTEKKRLATFRGGQTGDGGNGGSSAKRLRAD